MQPSAEEMHDINKVLARLRELHEQLDELGIVNMFPVGSVITRSLRKDSLEVDVILNFSNASLIQEEDHHDVLTP